VLFNNFQGFLAWCDTNNLSLLQFKKTTANLDGFCQFIEKNYKISALLNGIHCTEHLLHKMKKTRGNGNVKTAYLMRNMRMTACELG
jgi:hypothetical protein